MARRRSGSKENLLVEADWSRGMLRDMPRTAMPTNTVYDSVDYLLDRPGVARKRGGTSYYGPAVAASVPSLVDSSASAHDITVHGGAHVETAQKKFGDASANFDGSGDYLSLDGSADFIFGSGDFTVDFWLWLSTAPGTTARLYDSRSTGGNITVANQIAEMLNAPGTSYQTTGTLAPTANKLYLCSVSIPGGQTVTSVAGCGLTWVKVREVTQGTSSYVTVFRAQAPSGLSTGKLTITFSSSVSGRMLVSVDEFTGTTTGGSNGSAAIVQSQPSSTLSATAISVTLSPFASTSNMAFGAFGTNGGSDPTQGSGFTKLYAAGGGGNRILTEYKLGQANPSATGATGAWTVIGIEIAAAAYPLISVNSAAKIVWTGAAGSITAATGMTTGAWHHVAVSRSGSTLRAFVDGTVIGTLTDTASYTVGASRPTIGGSGATEGSESLNGYIDELRVSNSARYTANFTPAVAAYTPDANTKFLMHGDQFFASATSLGALILAEFPNGSQLLTTADDAHLYQITATSSTDIGSIGNTRKSPLCKPVLHVSGTTRVIFPASDGTSAPVAYNGTAIAALPASAPAGQIAAVYKARPLLANSAANPNRLWFGPLDLGSAWDTANAWVDFDHPVTGMVQVRNALLVFSAGHTDYITGSVPPGTQGFDMAQGPVGDIGCVDARSIATWEANAIFANTNGVYLTNGAGFKSLTEPPELGNNGIGTYWRSLLIGRTSNWQIHGEVVGNYYLVTIRDGTDTLIDTLMCYLPKRAWWRISNFDAGMYTPVLANAQEMYYAAHDAPRVVAISGIFNPTAANKNDANGQNVAPVLETRFYGTGPVLKAYGFSRITYDLRDAASDLPTLAVALSAGAEATSFSDVAESPLPVTADADRKRVTLNKDAQGVTLRLTQSGPSAKTELYAIEVEERMYEATIDGED